MSFALTREQILDQSKTVTRRTGWKDATPGQIVQPVDRVMGFKKGERPQKLGGPIRFVSVTREALRVIIALDVFREGFPMMTPAQFVAMFKAHNGGRVTQVVTRIEFEYVEPRR